ncbi:hypothetical protein JCM19000A_16320 [Silvimonas sp. JCM 19000]
MSQILLGNIPPEVSVDDIRILLSDLGVPGLGEITLAEGLSDKLAALITLDLGDTEAAAVSEQLNGHLWHERMLSCAHTNLGWGQ